MKNFKGNLSTKIFSGLLIVLLSTLFMSPLQLVAKDCEEALVRCSVDAVIVGLLGGPKVGLLYMSACFIGYGWCIEYRDLI